MIYEYRAIRDTSVAGDFIRKDSKITSKFALKNCNLKLVGKAKDISAPKEAESGIEKQPVVERQEV